MSPDQEVARYCEATPIVKGDEQLVAIGPFAFESGGHLEDLRVSFVTHGRLNTRRDNALLLLPGTTNSRHSADGYIGAGKAFDPDRHFIIAFEAVGSGPGSKPSDGLHADFPRYTIRDLVRSQHEIVRRVFGLEQLAVAGASMGAFQALEWAIAHPSLVQEAVLIVPAVRASSIFRMVVRNVAAVLRMDPAISRAVPDMTDFASLELAARMYFPWTVSDAYLERMPLELIEREISVSVRRSAQWPIWDYLLRYQASASHDVSKPFGGHAAAALARGRARTLVLPVSSDRLLGVSEAHEIARHVAGARLVEIASDRGHLGWRAVPGAAETLAIDQAIRNFFEKKDPSP